MVRVVLHEAKSRKEYDRLDMEMGKKGFRQELLGKKATYYLPEGDYWYSGDSTVADVRIIAAAAADELKQDFGVVAVKVDGWSVMGLKKVASASQG